MVANSFPDDAQNFTGQFRIWGGGWLVKAKYLRIHSQRPGDGHPLLTAGKLIRVTVLHAHSTMIAVTHEMEFAKSVADVVTYIADGVIGEMGSPEQVFDNPQSEKPGLSCKLCWLAKGSVAAFCNTPFLYFLGWQLISLTE